MEPKNNPLNELIDRVKNAPAASDGEIPIIEYDYRIEIIRKAIHLCSLSIPVLYFMLDKPTALTLLIPLMLAFLVADLARYYNKSAEEWFYRYFRFLLRKRESNKEKKTLNGATYVLISATICVIIFPKIITVTSFTILIICDITAALVGRRFGKHRFIAKSLEGSTGFFLSGLVVIALTPKIGYQPGEYLIGFAAVLVGTVAEALPADIDDNLSIPVTVGATLWLLYSVFLPMLNIYKFG
jgi:dolichol kinase